ncbi:hypothetical protein MNBD_NITROSPINAE02-89 [hydrothermal vent metagenome]|uniref:NolW-like domain-containing protein n=1 Tax=hydrothermal vent metagenome TaxID=652676 RepID=A0A3B1BV47_9ZZZZ
MASRVSQMASRVSQMASHVSQVASHVSQVASHVSQVARFVILFVLLQFFLAPATSYPQPGTAVEVYKIYYQNAQDLEEAVKAVLSGNGSVTIVRNANAIVVRDYRYNLKLVKDIIARLDTQPKSINIEVKFVEESELRMAGIAINWRATREGWNIGTIPASKGGANINLNASVSSLKTERRQFLRILENRHGKIFVGESVPFSNYYYNYGVNHGYLSQNTTFKNAGTSFSVTAKTVPGKKIKVILEPEVSYYDRNLRSFSVKNASTEVVTDNPGMAVIASSAGDTESFGSKFLMGVENGEKKTRFVIILSVRSE